MESREVLRRRRTVRPDTAQPLAPEVVERVLDAALRAPSAGSSQGWAFLALNEPADRARSWPYVPTRATQTPTMLDAPLGDEPVGGVTVGHRHLAPQDAQCIEERRRRKGHW